MVHKSDTSISERRKIEFLLFEVFLASRKIVIPGDDRFLRQSLHFPGPPKMHSVQYIAPSCVISLILIISWVVDYLSDNRRISTKRAAGISRLIRRTTLNKFKVLFSPRGGATFVQCIDRCLDAPGYDRSGIATDRVCVPLHQSHRINFLSFFGEVDKTRRTHVRGEAATGLSMIRGLRGFEETHRFSRERDLSELRSCHWRSRDSLVRPAAYFFSPGAFVTVIDAHRKTFSAGF